MGAVVVLEGAGYRREHLRAREEEGGLRRVARAEGEAEKALGRLLSRRFACEAEARRALEEASGKLPHHRLVYLGVQEERRLRWVFGLFIWVRLAELEGRPLVLNLAPHHETAVRSLGAGRYYLLE